MLAADRGRGGRIDGQDTRGAERRRIAEQSAAPAAAGIRISSAAPSAGNLKGRAMIILGRADEPRPTRKARRAVTKSHCRNCQRCDCVVQARIFSIHRVRTSVNGMLDLKDQSVTEPPRASATRMRNPAGIHRAGR